MPVFFSDNVEEYYSNILFSNVFHVPFANVRVIGVFLAADGQKEHVVIKLIMYFNHVLNSAFAKFRKLMERMG